MSFGFTTPPDFGLFFGGLCISVFGLILAVFYSSRVNLSELRGPRSGANKPVQTIKPPKQVIKPKSGPIANIGKNVKPSPKPEKTSKKVKTPKTVLPDDKKPSISTKSETEKPVKKIVPVSSRPVPKKISKNDLSNEKSSNNVPPEFTKKPWEQGPASKIVPSKKDDVSKIVPSKKDDVSKIVPSKKDDVSKIVPSKKDDVSKIVPSKKDDVSKKIPSKAADSEPVKPVLLRESGSVEPTKKPEKSKPVPKHIDISKLRSSKSNEKEDKEYVKNRLDRLKENYLKNSKDIESIIDERLDSFKGTLNSLKSESQEPSIIWSFDAGDVQDALKDTISKANTKILMMYPWIRNIDVGILKKFMDTESRMIIQEASLDDDTSVELIRLLMQNEVKVRTMPHIHTVAVVSDTTNGLIISTDPIYESFEVGVMYKDQKSIEEIERLFEDAWSISKDVDMELKK